MRPQKVRIVHPGGPAYMATVHVGDVQLLSVSKIELVLDASENGPVRVRLTIEDPELDIRADLVAVETGGQVYELPATEPANES